MKVRAGGARVVSTAVRVISVILVAALVVGAAFTAGRTTRAHADDLAVTGTLSLQPDETIAVDDGSSIYSVVSGIDLAPFLGHTVDLIGTFTDETLFVNNLTFGLIAVDAVDGMMNVTTTGTIEQAGGGYQATVEGITFTLVGDAGELAQDVGQTVQIQGQLTGSWISVTGLGP